MKIDRDEMAKPINPIRSSQIFQYLLCTYVIEPVGDLSLGFAKEAIGMRYMAKQINPDKVQIFRKGHKNFKISACFDVNIYFF